MRKLVTSGLVVFPRLDQVVHSDIPRGLRIAPALTQPSAGKDCTACQHGRAAERPERVEPDPWAQIAAELDKPNRCAKVTARLRSASRERGTGIPIIQAPPATLIYRLLNGRPDRRYHDGPDAQSPLNRLEFCPHTDSRADVSLGRANAWGDIYRGYRQWGRDRHRGWTPYFVLKGRYQGRTFPGVPVGEIRLDRG